MLGLGVLMVARAGAHVNKVALASLPVGVSELVADGGCQGLDIVTVPDPSGLFQLEEILPHLARRVAKYAGEFLAGYCLLSAAEILLENKKIF